MNSFFIALFFHFKCPPKWCTNSAGMAGAVAARSVYFIQPWTCHFMQSHIRTVHACLAVTCHQHFWQNDRDILRATAVIQCFNVVCHIFILMLVFLATDNDLAFLWVTLLAQLNVVVFSFCVFALSVGVTDVHIHGGRPFC